jgi:serine/threonine-protein kinase
VAKGLAHAHAQGVVHRDLKPANVFLCQDGQVKVLDFGLAHAFGRRRQDGGTPAYMAPEQLAGAPEDERTDVFALGVMLFEMLSGKLPFPDAKALASSSKAPLLETPAAPALGQLVGRMLAKEPVGRPRDGGSVEKALSSIREAPAPVGPSPAPVRVRRRLPRLAAMGLLAALLGAVVAGALALYPRLHPRPSGLTVPSIAVLPFADMSPGKDQDYFADGIAEEILGALTRVPGLRVPGRSSSFWFKGKKVEPAEIARKLGVTHLLEGSVRRSGSKLRITAEVVVASTGDRVWSENYERELTDVFAIQDEIARSVVRELAPMLLARTAPPPPAATTDPEAYRLFLLGLALFAQETPESIRRALEALERSAALDPRFAPTQATLAAVRGFVQQVARGEEFRQLGKAGREAAERAVALDPSASLGYVSRAWYRMRQDLDWEGATEDLDRAMAIDPANEWVLNIRAILLYALGRTRESVEVERRAVDLSPLNVILTSNLAAGLASDGRYAEAREWARRSLEISPGHRRAAQVLGNVALLTGKAQEALTEFERCSEPFRSAGIVAALHSLGRERESRDALARLEGDHTDEPVFIAGARAWLGDHDGAFAALDRAVQERNARLWAIKTLPLLRPIRGDPRFVALLKKMNLPVD